MKLISWNVNGIRACLDKGFLDVFAALDADFFCLQETKAQPEQVKLDLPGYLQFWHSAEKKGYSGTAIFTRHKPLRVSYGVGVEELDHEERVRELARIMVGDHITESALHSAEEMLAARA